MPTTMKKIDVAGRPVRGNPDAKVTIINYDDFECPFCARMHSTLMSEILPQYGDKIKIVYKDYPLSMHPWAKHAANNANCLAKESGQGYWEFADYVHANQRAINGSQKDVQNSFNELDHITLDIGKKNGADATRLQACVKAQPDTAMKASMAEADSIGVNATPTALRQWRTAGRGRGYRGSEGGVEPATSGGRGAAAAAPATPHQAPASK